MSMVGRLTDAVERVRRLAILGLFACVLIFVLFEALRGEQFWNKIKGEGNLWNYGSSLLYFMAAEMAIVNAILLGYYRNSVRRDGRSWQWLTWAAAGAAFVFFACDEMLEVHEKLGLAMERSLPWLKQVYPGQADNLISAAYLTGAVVFVLVFFRFLPVGRQASMYLIGAFSMIAFAVVLDVAPRWLYISYLPFRETEELLEVFAGFSFTAAFISSGAYVLSRILRAFADLERVVEFRIGGAKVDTRPQV